MAAKLRSNANDSGIQSNPILRQCLEADVEVTFAPTRSRYTYSRLVEADLGLLSPSPLVRHAGRTPTPATTSRRQVQAMAYRVALATARRFAANPQSRRRPPKVACSLARHLGAISSGGPGRGDRETPNIAARTGDNYNHAT